MGAEDLKDLLPTWKRVFREGLAPVLSTKGLEALRRGLSEDDPKLEQGCTTTPPPMQCVLDWPVEGACVVGYCAWQGDGLETVGEVEEFFAKACFEADKALGEPAAVRHFLNWFDDTPRDEMRKHLLEEVKRELALRPGGHSHGTDVVAPDPDGPDRPAVVHGG